MKELSGRQVAGFVQQRQTKQFAAMSSKLGRKCSLAIIQTTDDPVISTYVRAKMRYGAEVGAEVQLCRIEQDQVPKTIEGLNDSREVDGIIVQLPLADDSQRSQILNGVSLAKDVDGLASGTEFLPATPRAVMWLIDAYNIDLKGEKILIIGKGALVGAPLEELLSSQGHDVTAVGKGDGDISSLISASSVIICAAGSPGLVKPDMIDGSKVIIDAGVASDKGVSLGDVDPSVFESKLPRAMTPPKGGVGPLTVCSLFENLLRAAEGSAKA